MEKELTKAAKGLFPFARDKRREFSWRENQTDFRVLVSELMLQQTQVSRVIEKYEPFLLKFPSLLAIKNASLGDLLLEWKGLGYMRRIKSLKAMAMQAQTLPLDREGLKKLPGIGDYTSGAVMAFAHNVFTPILETNIRTVLCFHFCKKEEVCTVLKNHENLVTILYEESELSARVFYEAMMDYGSFLKKEKTKVCSITIKQKPFKGSQRELRAKLLYQITEKVTLDTSDERSMLVLKELEKEGFIKNGTKGYEIAL